MIRSLALILISLVSPNAIIATEKPVTIGDKVDKLAFTDIRSLPRTMTDFGKKKAFVIVFTNTSCPLVQRYLPVLQEMSEKSKDVQFIAINCSPEDTVIAMATQSVKYDVSFPFVKDFTGDCARGLCATRTPECMVLDSEYRLKYRGRIDDQYRLGGTRKEATTHELRDAIDAVLAGKDVAKAETEVDGCPITFAKANEPKKNITFNEHVAPILNKHCWQCHQKGGNAPFTLTDYKQASSRVNAIVDTIADQRMPPWFASHDFGPFANKKGLTDEERSTINDWAKTGVAEGDKKLLVKAPESKDLWRIGTPDKILTTGEFKIPAKGDVPYQYSILPFAFTEDTWLRDVQILPDNPRVMHHCNMAYASVTEGFNESNFITGQVPGGEPMNLDPGVNVLIPKGSVLALQIHFVSTGKPETCKISVGMQFPREKVQKRLYNMMLTDTRFSIPPGAEAHKVKSSRVLGEDAEGVGLFSHMHLRGKDMTFTATPSGGKTETLLIIPNYNFSWQIPYRWETGKVKFAKGTKIECIARYDNSAFNPYNPDATKTVRNGPQTYHEMMVGFFFYTHANEKLDLKIDPKTGHVVK